MLFNLINKHLVEMKDGSYTNWLPSSEAYYTDNGGGFVKDLILTSDVNVLNSIVLNKLKELDINNIVAYRAITLDKIKTTDLGISWSLSEQHAYCYRSNHKLDYFYKYKALIPKESIDWYHTIQKTLSTHSYEKEICVIGDINIQQIEKRKKTTCELLEICM
jgi:hypothetical protein